MVKINLRQDIHPLQSALKFLRFLGSISKGVYWVLFLSLLLLALEYLATSLMIPIAQGSQIPESSVTRFWNLIVQSIGLKNNFRTFLWLFFIFMTARILLGYVLTIATTWLGKKIHKNLSGRIFSHILQVESLSKIYQKSIGHYISMAGDDTFKSGSIVGFLLQSIVSILSAGIALFVLYQFSVNAFIGLITFLFFIGTVLFFMLKFALNLNQNINNLSRELGTTFIEALNSLRSIRSLNSQQFVINTYAQQIGSYVKMLVDIEAIKHGIKILPAAILLIFAVFMLRPGNDVGIADATLFAGTIIIIRIFSALGQAVASGSLLLMDIRSVGNIDELVNLSQNLILITNGQNSKKKIDSIDLVGINFKYNDKIVINNISFNFEAGKTYAITGPSGSGKSTLADIILGFNEPFSGNILVNNTQITLSDARNDFILVEQQSKIFSTTIRENLLLGLKVTDEEIYRALSAVNLLQLIGELENGLDTKLTYLGENFSGGQLQRMGIARALIRNPSVLVLDEATSALDYETRAKVVSNLSLYMKSGIIIFITHDEDIAKLTDHILILN